MNHIEGGIVYYKYKYEYIVNQKKYTSTQMDYCKDIYESGDKIKVRYEINNPEKSVTEAELKKQIYNVFLSILCIIIIIVLLIDMMKKQ